MRTLEARLTKIEREIGPTGDATALYEEMLCDIRAALTVKVGNPYLPAPERADVEAKHAALNSEQWSRRHGDDRRLNIIDALREGRAADYWFVRIIGENDYDPDWVAVAAELGLRVPNLGSDRIRLLTRVIVSPKLRFDQERPGDALH